MKQPSVYTRSHVIDAALSIIQEKGWRSVTTRAIAKKLGSSTMPIYSHVKSVEELEKELVHRARTILKEFQQRTYTEDVLLNLAFGYVVFARDEKNLFRFLYLESRNGLDLEDLASMKNSFLEEFGEQSEAGKALTAMRNDGQETLIQYSWIFTHGLAMLINAGTVNSYSDQTILRHLRNAGTAFYLWGIGKGGENIEADDG